MEPDYLSVFSSVYPGKNSQLKLMKEKRRFSMFYLEITVEAAVMQDVQASLRRLLREKRM